MPSLACVERARLRPACRTARRVGGRVDAVAQCLDARRLHRRYWTILLIGLLLGLTALDAALPSRFATSVLEYVPHLSPRW